jgi:hypothetical protein
MNKNNEFDRYFEEEAKKIYRNLRSPDFQAPPCLRIPFERFAPDELSQWHDPSRAQRAVLDLLEMAPCLFTYLRLAPENGSVGIRRCFDNGDPEGCILSIDPVPRWWKYKREDDEMYRAW